MSALRDAFYSAFCALLQDMRDYRDHGEWFRQTMLPIQPMPQWEAIVSAEPQSSPKWHQGGYGWETPDFEVAWINGLVLYKRILLSRDIMRGRRATALRECVALHRAELHGIPSYFSLGCPLDSQYYTITLWVERGEGWANQLFARAIGRGEILCVNMHVL